MASLYAATAIDQLLQEAILAGDITVIAYNPNCFGVALPTTGATDSIVIDGDGTFIAYSCTGNVSQPAGTNIPFPDITINLQNAGSGRYFSKSAMHWNAFVGNAQNPFFFVQPLVLSPASNLSITLANLSGGSYARVDFQFVGIKVRSLNPAFNLLSLISPADFAYSQ